MGLTVGVVTGQNITDYRGGDTVRMLQVQLLGDNPETVEWFDITGEDTAPVNGDKVVILEIARNYKIAVATKDLITAAVSAGERKFYSRDSNGAVQAIIYLKNDGSIELNSGSDWAVQFTALQTAFNELKTAFNTHLHTGVTSGGASTGTTTIPSAADISLAKINKINVP